MYVHAFIYITGIYLTRYVQGWARAAGGRQQLPPCRPVLPGRTWCSCPPKSPASTAAINGAFVPAGNWLRLAPCPASPLAPAPRTAGATWPSPAPAPSPQRGAGRGGGPQQTWLCRRALRLQRAPRLGALTTPGEAVKAAFARGSWLLLEVDAVSKSRALPNRSCGDAGCPRLRCAQEVGALGGSFLAREPALRVSPSAPGPAHEGAVGDRLPAEGM